MRYSPLVRAIRRQLVGRPALFFPLARLAGNRQLLDDETELVVDGFPRSGNSFTEAAFLHSQAERGIALKSHAHSPAQVLKAIKQGVAAVVLLREPDEAVASMIAASSVDSPDMHYLDYCAYYRPLMGYEAGFVVAPFEQVLDRFAEVVDAVNARFGLKLHLPQVGEAFTRDVNEMRDKVSIARIGRTPNYSPYSEWGVAENRAGQSDVLARLQKMDTLPSRQAAIALHAHFFGDAGRAAGDKL